MTKRKATDEPIESDISKLASSATGAAYRKAIRTGSVVIYKDGEIRRIDAGGENVVVKKLGRRSSIPKGSKFELNIETV